MKHPHRHGVSSSIATGFELMTLWPRVCDHNHLSIAATRNSRNSYEKVNTSPTAMSLRGDLSPADGTGAGSLLPPVYSENGQRNVSLRDASPGNSSL
ncbi:hypothetical protein TNCV_1697501 [Trichonephila clavipes]|nr:hypothetical protein TNCV_1697501 [Trichonephila clavipes]